MSDLTIYIDGACRGNPGPAGIGVVIQKNGETIKEISKSIGEGTNNIAEYSALIQALEEALEKKAHNVQIYTDSELVYKQIMGQYKVKHPNVLPLHMKAKLLMAKFKDVKLTHVLREKNKEADKLASSALSVKR